MDTNFYWKVRGKGSAANEYDNHIGKRSAAGNYCWTCGRTLCRQGEKAIHQGHSDWYPVCPNCDAKPDDEGNIVRAVGVELGFSKPREDRPTGVHSCSSFTWAQDPEEVFMELGRRNSHKAAVIDEYGKTYTSTEFIIMLKNNCPVRFTDSIDREFS